MSSAHVLLDISELKSREIFRNRKYECLIDFKDSNNNQSFNVLVTWKWSLIVKTFV